MNAAANAAAMLAPDDLTWLLAAVLNASEEIVVDAAYLNALVAAALSTTPGTTAVSPTVRHVLDYFAVAIACQPSVSAQVS